MSRLTRDGCETKFPGANGDDMEMIISPVQLTTSRIGNLTRLTQSLVQAMVIHNAYILYGGLVPESLQLVTSSWEHFICLKKI